MTKERVIKVLREGLYCIDLPGNKIGLTDNRGETYEVISWVNNRIIESDGRAFRLAAWLGLE